MTPAQTSAYARRIGDAAAFFDAVRAALPERDKAEAEQHVEHLHDVAQILAGENCPAHYAPEDGAFEPNTNYPTNLVINRSDLELLHWRDHNGQVRAMLNINAHPMSITLFLKPTECRTFAAGLKQLADDYEASAAQATQQAPEQVAAHGCCDEEEVHPVAGSPGGELYPLPGEEA